MRLELSPSRPVFPGVRYERLEDQLNDLTELHQHETINLKQELAAIEEKVAYQAYERARDIQVRGGDQATVATFIIETHNKYIC